MCVIFPVSFMALAVAAHLALDAVAAAPRLLPRAAQLRLVQRVLLTLLSTRHLPPALQLLLKLELGEGGGVVQLMQAPVRTRGQRARQRARVQRVRAPR